MAKEKKEQESVNYALAAKTFVQEVVAESKKVVWPSREALTQSFMTVLGSIFIITVFMAVADAIWEFLFKLI